MFKLKPSYTAMFALMILIIGFFSAIITIGAHEGHYLPLAWVVLMLVVYLPVVSIICNKKHLMKVWQKTVVKMIAFFTLYGVIAGAVLTLLFR